MMKVSEVMPIQAKAPMMPAKPRKPAPDRPSRPQEELLLSHLSGNCSLQSWETIRFVL